jgi:hypothetical protein
VVYWLSVDLENDVESKLTSIVKELNWLEVAKDRGYVPEDTHHFGEYSL